MSDSDMDSTPETFEIHRAAGEVVRLSKLVRWGAFAVVVKRDVMFGLVRIFEVLAEHTLSRFRLFRECDEAESWLASVRSKRDAETDGEDIAGPTGPSVG